jgi:Phage capsid-like protein
MPDDVELRRTLSEPAARQLANATKTRAQMQAITPRWLISFLPWVPVEAGIYRLNKVKERDGLGEVECSPSWERDSDLPETFVDYDQTTTRIFPERGHDPSRCPDPIYNADYGLLTNAAPSIKISTRRGPPTPDDLDELVAKVWKEPAFFLAHPRAIAAFGRECTRRGVPPPTINLFGTPFLTWRGLPLVPSDKLKITEATNGTGKTTVLLMRTGEKKQGVVGLFQPGVPGEVTPSFRCASWESIARQSPPI